MDSVQQLHVRPNQLGLDPHLRSKLYLATGARVVDRDKRARYHITRTGAIRSLR